MGLPEQSKLPPGAVIIIIGETPLEEMGLNTGIVGANEAYVKSFQIRIMIETENGDMLAFTPGYSPGQDFYNVFDYKPGENISDYIQEGIDANEIIYVNQDEYDSMYLQSPNWIDVPLNFFDTEIGSLTKEEAAMMEANDITIANQIEIAMDSFNTMYAGKTKFTSPTYKRLWQEGFLKYQDPLLANDYVLAHADYGDVLNDLDKTENEIAKTDFYNTNTEQYSLDLAKEKQYLYDLLPTGADVDDDVMEWMADKVVMGTWDQTYAQGQLWLLVDKYRDGERDPMLQSYISNKDITQTTDGINQMTALVDEWIPPSARQSYYDEIEKHAGLYRNDKSYQEEFERDLKEVKYNLYPMYDKDTKWDVIDRITKNTINNKWNMEIDPGGKYGYVYNKVAALNDVNKANQYLVSEGLSNNVPGVVQDFARDMMTAFGGNIVRSQNFIEQNRRTIE